MGKFKELAMEITRIKRNHEMRRLIVKYPTIAGFIEEAFAHDEEHKVYDLINAFDKGDKSCENYLH